MQDLIDRQAAIDGFYEMASDMDYLCTVSDYVSFLESLPSVQPECDGITWALSTEKFGNYQVEWLTPHCALESCKEEDAIVRFLHDTAQPEQQWIPCSEPPKESGTYIVTAYDGADKRVTFVKYQKTLKRWDLTGARSYWHILAYKPLPEPWRGEEHVPDE